MSSNGEINSSSVVQDDELAYSKEYFYNEAADTTVRLKDGKILKFNKTALVIQSGSRILHQAFCGTLSDRDVTDIPDVDFDTFKLFIDCIMNYQSYDFDNSLRIFPIVWKYQIQNLISKCIIALNPDGMSSKVCDVLNMGVFNGCQKLVLQTVNFIANYSCHQFLESYSQLLEPDSLKIIVFGLPIDSHIIEIVLHWAVDYMESNNIHQKTILKFLEDKDFLKLGLFELKYFESVSTLCKFSLSDIGKGFFSAEQILLHFQNSKDIIYGESEWKLVEKDDKINEEIIIPVDSRTSSSSHNLFIKFGKNKFVLYENFARSTEEKMRLMSCKFNVVGESSAGGTQNYGDCHVFSFYNDNLDLDSVFHTFVSNNTRYHGSCGPYISRYVLKFSWKFYYSGRVLLVKRQGYQPNSLGNSLIANPKLLFTNPII